MNISEKDVAQQIELAIKQIQNKFSDRKTKTIISIPDYKIQIHNYTASEMIDKLFKQAMQNVHSKNNDINLYSSQYIYVWSKQLIERLFKHLNYTQIPTGFGGSFAQCIPITYLIYDTDDIPKIIDDIKSRGYDSCNIYAYNISSRFSIDTYTQKLFIAVKLQLYSSNEQLRRKVNKAINIDNSTIPLSTVHKTSRQFINSLIKYGISVQYMSAQSGELYDNGRIIPLGYYIPAKYIDAIVKQHFLNRGIKKVSIRNIQIRNNCVFIFIATLQQIPSFYIHTTTSSTQKIPSAKQIMDIMQIYKRQEQLREYIDRYMY